MGSEIKKRSNNDMLNPFIALGLSVIKVRNYENTPSGITMEQAIDEANALFNIAEFQDPKGDLFSAAQMQLEQRRLNRKAFQALQCGYRSCCSEVAQAANKMAYKWGKPEELKKMQLWDIKLVRQTLSAYKKSVR